MNSPLSSMVLLDHSQDILVLLDEEGRFTYANAALEHLLGWERNDVLGSDAFEFVHPDDVEAARRVFEQTIASDEFAEAVVEHRFETSDGSWVWLESRMSSLTDEQMDGYVVSARDITDRVEAQAESRETAERLEQLSRATPDAMWLFNGDWSECLFVNSAYETLYGRPAEELQGDPTAFFDAIHPSDVPGVEAAMERLADGTYVDMEYRANPNRGYRTWVWVQGVPITRDDEVTRIAGVSKEITTRKRRERQLCVMDNLLRHNLRNDMGIILGNAELIEEEFPGAASRTGVIRRTGDELLESADKQRELVKILTDDSAPERAALDEVVSHAVETIRRRFPAAGVTVYCQDRSFASVLNRFQYAITELLENAIVHNDNEEPLVHVTLNQRDEQTVLIIEDDARPIPEMEANVLRGDHEMTAVYHSTGLGLWLVYWIVELSEGWITVESSAEGNRIRITIPDTRSPER